MTTAVLTGFSGCNVSAASSSVTNGGTSTPTVNLVPYNADPLETIWQQWLAGASDVAGKDVNFSVNLTNKETDSSVASTYDGPWWATAPDALTWTKVSSYNVAGGFMTFTVSPGAASTIYVASVPPHTLPRTLAWIQNLASTYSTLIHDDLTPRVRKAVGAYICGQSGTHRDDLSRTVSSLPMYGFRIGNDSAGPQAPNAKREIIVFCGVHSGEWHGFHQLQGFIDEWLTNSALSALRDNVNLYVYPAQSVGGMELGFRRAEAINSTVTSYDVNREWGDADGTVPTVAAWQDIIDEQHGVVLHNVVGFIDFHDATKNNATDGNAYFNYMSGMANFSAIETLLLAENSELAGVVTDVAVTTIEYFFVKGVNFSLTFEARDERNTITQTMDYGRAVARAVKSAYDAGYLSAYDTRAFGAVEVESFESGSGDWNLSAGGSVAWTRSNGTAPTTNTGADTAFSGSYRIFTEAGTSGAPVAEGATFAAERTGIDFTKYAEMRFRWCRYGCVSSTLAVQVDNGSGYTTVWSTNVNLSAISWKMEGIDLSGYSSTSGKVRFLVTVSGSNRHNNDQDIDYIEFVPWAVASSSSVQQDCIFQSSGVAAAVGDVVVQSTGYVPVQADTELQSSALAGVQSDVVVQSTGIAGVQSDTVVQSSGAGAVFQDLEVRTTGLTSAVADLSVLSTGLVTVQQDVVIQSDGFVGPATVFNDLVVESTGAGPVQSDMEIQSSGVQAATNVVDIRSSGLALVQRDVVVQSDGVSTNTPIASERVSAAGENRRIISTDDVRILAA